MGQIKSTGAIFVCVLMFLGLTGIAQAGLSDGLVAYYPFNGNASDESGNGNHGVIFNADFVEGVVESGLQFTGSLDSFVEVPHSDALTPSAAVTVSVWAKPLSTSPAFSALIYKAGEEPTSNGFLDRCYSLWTTSSQGLHLTSTPESATSQVRCDSSGLYGLNQFVHFVAIVDTVSRTMSMYINGSMVQQCPFYGEAIRGGDYPLRIGGAFHTLGDQFNFNGVIDEVRIYNRALSEAEIQELYAYNPTPQPAGHLVVSPSSYDFGLLPMGRCSAYLQQFTMSNIGDASLDVSDIRLSDSANYVLNLSDGPTACAIPNPTLPPASSCTASVAFCPLTDGIVSATLEVVSNDPGTPMTIIPIHGSGQTVQVPFAVSPPALDFDVIAVGSTKRLELVLTNVGSDVISGTLSTSGPFALASSGSFKLKRGKSTMVLVNFSPSSRGSFMGTLSIETASGQLYVGLRGSAKETNQIPLDIPTPRLQAEQKFKAVMVKTEFVQQMASKSMDLAGDDSCLHGAVQAAGDAQIASDLRVMGDMAVDIMLLPAKMFSTGSLLGDLILSAGSAILGKAMKSTPLDEAALTFITNETMGYVLPKIVTDYYGGAILSTWTEKAISSLLEKERDIYWTLRGNNEGPARQNSGAPLAVVDVQVFYSPYSHFTTAVIGAQCTWDNGRQKEETWVVRYELKKEKGWFGGTPTVVGTPEYLQVR